MPEGPHTAAADSQERESEPIVWSGVWFVIMALFGSGIALWWTTTRCRSDSGEDVFAPRWVRSSYCQALDLPRFPHGLGSLCLAAAVFVSPTVIALAGLLLAARRQRFSLILRAALLWVPLVVTGFVLALFAHVRYLGAG